MRFFDVGQEAHGFIAIGQFATGVLALGQVAHGLVAVGQVAFGGIAIGQVAVGGFTLGMGSAGLYYALGMIGVGGRGRGLILPLLPRLGSPKRTPQLEPYAELARTQGSGWILLTMEPRKGARIALYEGEERLKALRLDARVRLAAIEATPATVYAHVRPSEVGPVVDRLVHRDPSRLLQPHWWLLWGAQLAGLVVLAAIIWMAVAEPLLSALLS
ncbi:MAG TPA: hypothetical protein ENK18_16440 [Deltaproteobacteria bacterium]|nr:hypothetical protein [Deltaproteobacteria bacterium]